MTVICLPVAIIALLLSVSCSGLYYDETTNTMFAGSSNDEIDGGGGNDEIIENESSNQFVCSNDVLERAYQMANVIWTPIKPIPIKDGFFYQAGKERKGIPYSAVAEINTYLFQDVSYHTFMTAVHNPSSLLYTENISHEPYHGKICSTYYGAVCSSSVMWALGISIPYYADQIIHLPFIMKNEHQSIDSLRVCDIIWKPGHVQMVYAIEKEDEKLSMVTTFESSWQGAHIKVYSKDEFEQLWNDGGYVGYRYQYIRYSNEPYVPVFFEQVDYNDDLCPTKGDRSVYRDNDHVVINIFSKEYNSIVLKKGNQPIAKELIREDEHIYQNLPVGIYSVTLQNELFESKPISFEIIKTDVSVSVIGNNQLLVSFSSSAIPEYVALCTIDGISNCFEISEQDRKKGSIVLPQQDWPEYYCKVIFKGEYGRIINRPIRVR